MPTVFYKYGLRFYFVSYDCNEPAHIHVSNNANKVCKYWLKNGIGVFSDNRGFTKVELRKIETEINSNFELLNNAFNEYCNNNRR